jgi:hypothetical protein
MTEESARKIANGMLAAAVLGAAYVVVTRPALRRVAWQLAKASLTGALPAWFAKEVREAWIESGRRTRTL